MCSTNKKGQGRRLQFATVLAQSSINSSLRSNLPNIWTTTSVDKCPSAIPSDWIPKFGRNSCKAQRLWPYPYPELSAILLSPWQLGRLCAIVAMQTQTGFPGAKCPVMRMWPLRANRTISACSVVSLHCMFSNVSRAVYFPFHLSLLTRSKEHLKMLYIQWLEIPASVFLRKVLKC